MFALTDSNNFAYFDSAKHGICILFALYPIMYQEYQMLRILKNFCNNVYEIIKKFK